MAGRPATPGYRHYGLGVNNVYDIRCRTGPYGRCATASLRAAVPARAPPPWLLKSACSGTKLDRSDLVHHAKVMEIKTHTTHGLRVSLDVCKTRASKSEVGVLVQYSGLPGPQQILFRGLRFVVL